MRDTVDGGPIRVLVVDDHAVFRAGLRAVLEGEPDLTVVGEAADGMEAVVEVAARSPDVVLLDLRMPRRGGIATTADVVAGDSGPAVLVLSVSDDPADLFAAIEAGAAGYLLKETPAAEIAAAIRSVHGGQPAISPRLSGALLSGFTELTRRGQPPVRSARTLTGRETEVLTLVARGLGNRDVAARLGISENTVKNHVRNVLEKLRLHSRTEAVVHAVREHLIVLDDEAPA